MGVGVSQANQGNVGTTLITAGVTTQVSGSAGVLGVIGDTGFFTSVQDSNSNTWTQIQSELADATAGNASRMYYAQNMTGGASHTFTLNKSSGSFAAIFFLELTTMLTSGVLDQSNRVLDTASPFDSPSVTTLSANEVLVALAFADDGGANSYVAGNSFTIQQQRADGSISWTGAIASRIVTATGSYNSTFTRTGAARVHSWIATFIEQSANKRLLLLGAG